MIDFKKLIKEKRTTDVTNLLAIFESQDRRTSHLELRTVQREAIKLLNQRRKDRDLILKISTGAGKTTIALLYLLSHMEESHQPVVYLCPTKQLVEQVHEEANKLGIKSVIYPAGEPHPSVEGISGKAIIICTYDKLFNAKTTFDRPDVNLRPIAIVCDDAHAGVEEIRDAFTLSILSISDFELHRELLEVFDSTCENFHQSKWYHIKAGDPHTLLEIPFWIWDPLTSECQKILSKYEAKNDLKFVWPYLQDMLRWCRCIISGNGIEIAPEILPVHKCQAYTEAKHRLFMSATLADDSVLIRELGCDINAAHTAILPNSDKGMGERMVLTPSLITPKLNRELIMKLCAKISSKLNVCVLSPNTKTANDWEAFGAKIVTGDDVSVAVKEMKKNSEKYRFVVFTQRYDGIDLPDNACRLLAIDGLPVGEGIIDKYDSHQLATAGGIRNRLIYRIEQGMGRAVRSHADYAVILLVGPELSHFIAKHDVLNAMNPDTRTQLKLALELSKYAKEDENENPVEVIVDLIKKCLSRDKGWRQYYAENMKEHSQITSDVVSSDKLALADSERRAFYSAIANNSSESVKELRSAINEHLKDDVKTQGWYLQRVANYLHDTDPAEALEVQRTAFDKNKAMLCPPGTISRPLDLGKRIVSGKFMKWFKQFDNPNGVIAEVQSLRARLSYSQSPSTFEQAIMDLAILLGAEGSRPDHDYRAGPDDLWIWPNISLVIEAKNQNKKTLHKKDAGQLHVSLQWFEKEYPRRCKPIPIIVAKVSKGDRHSGFPDNCRILTPEKMKELLDKLENFFLRLAEDPSYLDNPKEIQRLQNSFNLLPEQFVNSYTVKLEEVDD